MNRLERDTFCGSPTTMYQRIAAVASLVLLTGVSIYLLCLWKTLPETIATNFDGKGMPNEWGTKGTLWILPGAALLIHAVLWMVERLPKAWNTGIRITPQNRVLVYRAMRDLFADLRIALTLFFGGNAVILAQTPERLPLPVLFLLMALILVPLLRMAIRLIRIKFLVG